MARMIDADKLITAIQGTASQVAMDAPYDPEWFTRLAARQFEILKMIDDAPTVDAVELPCKIGDLVWGIKKFNHGTERAKQGIVHMMFFGEDMRLCICVKGVCRGEWGKNVFDTKEEALAKMDGDGNA